MVAILKVLRHIENLTPSLDAYLLEKLSCQISSLSDLKMSPKQEQEQQRDEQRYWISYFLIQKTSS